MKHKLFGLLRRIGLLVLVVWTVVSLVTILIEMVPGDPAVAVLGEQATPEQLARPSTNPYTKEALPTVGDGVAFLLTGHLGVHLGQLSTWRRMIGLGPLF